MWELETMNAIKDGIYFRMPEDQYLAVERLSKSGIKRLRVSPADFWADSWLNPNPAMLTPEQKKRQQLARLLGRAYHCARLEPFSFHDRYVRELSQADYAEADGFLSTGTAMGAKLEELGLKKSGAVMEQARRLRDEGGYSPSLIWHLELERWANDKGERTAIPAEPWDQILMDMERIAKVPAVHELLTGGEPEVSVFWTCPETGIPMKARLDYLKPDRWVEFKSFANPNGKHLFQCLTDGVRFNRYHIDVVTYLHALEMIRTGGLEVVGEAEVSERELVEAIQLQDHPLACHLVFQQKGGVPNVLERRFALYQATGSETAIKELEEAGATEDHLARARRFQEIAGSQRQPTAIHAKAAREIKAAKRDFLAYSEIYPVGDEWLPFNPSGEIGDNDFSPYWLEEEI